MAYETRQEVGRQIIHAALAWAVLHIVGLNLQTQPNCGLGVTTAYFREHRTKSPNPEPLATSVLLIDGISADRIYFVEQLKRCSSAYQIIEATDGQSGLDLNRSRRVECVVLELALPVRSCLGSAPLLRTPDLRPIMGQEGCYGTTTEVYSRVQT